MSSNVEETILSGRNVIVDKLRKNIYDVVAAIIIVAIVAASLHVFNIVDFSKNTWDTVTKFIMDWLPYFAAAMLLNNTLYQKGVFVGKGTLGYVKTSQAFAKSANELNGKQLESLQEFCDKYNSEALEKLQTNILKTQAIPFEKFDKEFEVNGVSHMPLKAMSKSDLFKEYSEEHAKTILLAKRAKVKGINVNIILGQNDNDDPTNLGETESQLTKSYNKQSVFTYLLSTAVTSLIVVNDISTWGWANLIAVVFKVAYLVSRTLMSYFDGYNNATVKMVNHFARKSDVLKEFKEWYASNHT